MTTDLTPHNELERVILEFHRGNLDREAFARSLPCEQVFVPVRDDDSKVGGLQRSTHAEPLLVEDEYGVKVLILFSSPERSKGFLRSFSEFQGGMTVDFSSMLRRMGEGVGIAINPGMDIGFDLEPDMVQALISTLPAES